MNLSTLIKVTVRIQSTRCSATREGMTPQLLLVLLSFVHCNLIIVLLPPRRAESGYKGSEFPRYPPNFRGKIFKEKSTAARKTAQPHPLRESGCKGTALFPNRKTFHGLFYRTFSHRSQQTIIINGLSRKKFSKQYIHAQAKEICTIFACKRKLITWNYLYQTLSPMHF